MFSGVYQIPGSHCFKAKISSLLPGRDRKIANYRWYELLRNKYQGTFEEAAEEFERLFKSSIALHLRSDVPTGTALSGGLDSSAIVCEMNNILKKQGVVHLQKTFSSCSVDERYDEKKWIDIVVNHTAVDSHLVYPKLTDVFKLTPDLIWYHDEPYQSQSAYLAYHVFQLVKSTNVKVLLNGQGADEYLGGYGQFTYARLIKKLRSFRWIEVFSEIRHSHNFSEYTKSLVFKSILSSILPDALKRFLVARLDKCQSIKKGLIDHVVLGSINKSANKTIPVDQKTIPDISKHGTFYSTLPKYLKWEDRNSMANSVEARVPFLDYRLVEFAYSLPDDYLDFQGETKRILRYGLKDILPEKIKNRKDKNGFLTPEESWVREDNPALFRQKIEDAIKLTKGVIKPEALKYYDKLVAGRIPFDYTYWRLILFAEWIKRFNVKMN